MTGNYGYRHSSKSTQTKSIFINSILHKACHSIQSIPVRYWLARSLGVGKHPDDEASLITLMQDSHPNVVCQALYSIGKRKFQKATAKLLATIEVSGHWYVQLYTYNALRKLGWKQNASD